MSVPKRKISYYRVSFSDPSTDAPISPVFFPLLIQQLSLQPDSFRTWNDTPAKKAHILLSHISKPNGIYHLILGTGKIGHRPDLRDFTAHTTRTNPKTLSEGEEEHTHFSFKVHQDSVTLLAEERKAGITAKGLLIYLKKMNRHLLTLSNIPSSLRSFNYEVGILECSDFLTALRNLDRVHIGEIFVDKQLLGSASLNYSRRLQRVKSSISIKITAEKKASIFQPMLDIFRSHQANPDNIKRIKVVGYNVVGEQLILDTDIMKRIEYKEVDLDPSTETITNPNELFLWMESKLRELNEDD